MELRILRKYHHELAPGEQLRIGGTNSYVTRNEDKLQFRVDLKENPHNFDTPEYKSEWKDVEIVELNDPEPPAYKHRRLKEEARREEFRSTIANMNRNLRAQESKEKKDAEKGT